MQHPDPQPDREQSLMRLLDLVARQMARHHMHLCDDQEADANDTDEHNDDHDATAPLPAPH